MRDVTTTAQIMEIVMRKFIPVLALVPALLIMSGPGQPAAAQDFYDVSTVHTIEIVFNETNWDHILDSLFADGNKERLLATAFIDGEEFDSVGVRYKGFSTYSPDRVKNPLNVKLDYTIDGQEIQGYGTLKLANVWFDPSFLREVLGYEIARKYTPASLANYANVYINGTLMGLYVSDQDVDKLFCGRTSTAMTTRGSRGRPMVHLKHTLSGVMRERTRRATPICMS